MNVRTQSDLINTNSSKLADTVRLLFENTASEYGEEYFRQMVLQLADSLGADYAFIGELDKDEAKTINTLAFYQRGKILQNITYKLANTPCENVVDKSPCLFAHNVAEQFPQDDFLSENSIKAYLGVPLFNSGNEAIGLIVCMFKQTIQSPQFVKDVIQVFSSRISTEIERMHLEDKLRKSENRFRHIAENSAAWIWEVDQMGKYTYTSNKIHEILGYHPSELIGEKYFYDFYPQLNLEDYKKIIFSSFQDKKKVNGFENKKINKNGETVWFKTSGVPIISHSGELLGYRGTSIDISEQKRTEIQVIKQNEFLTTLINTLNYPFHIINVNDYSIAHLNSLKTIANKDTKSTCYKISHNRETPCSGNEHPCPLKTVLKTGKSLVVEHNHINENGDYYPCEVHCHPIFDKEGNVSQVIEYSIDKSENEAANRVITERVKELQCLHQLTQALEKHKSNPDANFSDVVDIIPEGFQYPKKTSCSILFYGTEYKTANFQSSNWILTSPLYNGKKLIGRIKICYNQKLDTDPFIEEEKELLETIAQQLSAFIEQQHNEKLRDVIYKISEASNTTDNLPELIDLIHKQLTHLIDTSNFYVALYNEQNDYFSVPYSIDQEVDIPSFPAGKSLTKYVIQKQSSLLVTSNILDKLESNGEVISVGKPSKVWLGVPLILKDKAIGVISVQNYQDENAYDQKDLEILEFVSHQISISVQRKMVEDDLKKALIKAQESDQLKTAFLSAISHELRTPLNAIIGFSELISNEWNKEQTIEFSKLINQSGRNLLSIVDNILSITQLEGQNIRINQTKLQVQAFCLNLLNKIRNENDQDKLQKLTINFKPSVSHQDLWILTDQDKLYQILYNLLNNAVKFTPKGEIIVAYLVENRENKSFIKFSIKDSGIGISQKNKDLIFNLFRQEDDSQSRKFGGIGIGLSIAKKYTELLHGHIEVESELGKGSEFTVWIPLEPNLIPSN